MTGLNNVKTNNKIQCMQYMKTLLQPSRSLSVTTFNTVQKTMNADVNVTTQPQDKSSPGDEIPERDVTCHLLCLLIYQ